MGRAERRAFFSGDWVAYQTPSTGGIPTLAAIRLEGQTLRSGIISIKNLSGTGLQDFIRFRAQSLSVAKAFGASEAQIFGGAFINQELEASLLRVGFRPSTGVVPDALGGGTMEILSRVYPIR